MDFEQTIMELLVHSGSARSSALMALQRARAGDFVGAQEMMDESRAATREAHGIQTTLIEDLQNRSCYRKLPYDTHTKAHEDVRSKTDAKSDEVLQPVNYRIILR